MILDDSTTFCAATAASTAGTTTGLAYGSVKDLESAPNTTRDLGAGKPVYLVIQVRTAFTSGGSATVDLQLRSAAAAALTSSPTTHYSTGAIAVASLTTAFRRVIKLPSENYQRFLGIVQVIATAALTAGAIDAFLTNDPREYRTYTDGVSGN